MTETNSSASDTNRPPLGLVLKAVAVCLLLFSYPFILAIVYNYHEVSLSPRAMFWQMFVPAKYPLWNGMAFIVVYIPVVTMIAANNWKVHFIAVATTLSAAAYPTFIYVFNNTYPFTRFSTHFGCVSENCLPAFICGWLMVYAIGAGMLTSTLIFRVIGRQVFPKYRDRIRQHAIR
jgi:hypothetical protein